MLVPPLVQFIDGVEVEVDNRGYIHTLIWLEVDALVGQEEQSFYRDQRHDLLYSHLLLGQWLLCEVVKPVPVEGLVAPQVLEESIHIQLILCEGWSAHLRMNVVHSVHSCHEGFELLLVCTLKPNLI